MNTVLFEVTKIQILKVIHNFIIDIKISNIVVGSHKDTNFESNSQQFLYSSLALKVVRSHKDTNFESNSQQSNLEQEKIFPKDKEVEKGNFY